MKYLKSKSVFFGGVMTGANNNVGTNTVPAKMRDDIHFDLAPTTGTDVSGSKTGQLYSVANLGTIAETLGAKYTEDGSLYVQKEDVIIEVEFDLKPIGGHGYNEGDLAQEIVATTADGAYNNNGGWTDIDPQGGRNDGEEVITDLPTSVESVFVVNGSVAVVHLTFRKP